VEQKRGSDPWMQIYMGLQTSIQVSTPTALQLQVQIRGQCGERGRILPFQFHNSGCEPPQADVNFTQYVYLNGSLTVQAVVTDAIR